MEHIWSIVHTGCWQMNHSYPRLVCPIQKLQNPCGTVYGGLRFLTKLSISCGGHQMSLYLLSPTFAHDTYYRIIIVDFVKSFQKMSSIAYGFVTMSRAFGSRIRLSPTHVQRNSDASVIWCPLCYRNYLQVQLRSFP